MKMDKELLIFIAILLFVFLVTITGAYLGDLISCKAKTNALGYEYEYGLFKGCVVEKQDGQKALLEQLRDIGY